MNQVEFTRTGGPCTRTSTSLAKCLYERLQFLETSCGLKRMVSRLTCYGYPGRMCTAASIGSYYRKALRFCITIVEVNVQKLCLLLESGVLLVLLIQRQASRDDLTLGSA